MTNRALIIGLLFATVLALALRVPQLGARPMHNDEAVNALKLRALMERGFYRYDPREYHGPTLYYSALGWTKLLGVTDFAALTEAQLRALTVLFGVGLILLLPLVADGLGVRATIFAGVLTAVSPAMVYYSRDFIHETLLVFFTFLAMAAGWRWFRTRRLRWAIVAGMALGLMHATKETFVLALAAMVLGVFLNGHWLRDSALRFKAQKSGAAICLAIVAWAVVVVVLFSSFFTHFGGVLDSVKTFLPMLHRAGGESFHVHSWDFYFERLIFFHVKGGPVWTEGTILLLALAGMFFGFSRRAMVDSSGDFIRFLTFYTIALALIYSMISYKTPWCLLGFWHGAILLAGAGVGELWERAANFWKRLLLTIVLVAGIMHLAIEAWQASIPFCADRKNPYVYAQTSENCLELISTLNEIAAAGCEGTKTPVDVIAPGADYWPLPWYLRGFGRTAWWSERPRHAPATIVVFSKKMQLPVGEGFVSAGLFELRPGEFFEVQVASDLWNSFLARRRQDSNQP